MIFDLDPLELVACALTAVMLAIPLSFALAAGAVTGPHRTWNSAGLAMGLGLLIGVGLTAAGVLAGPFGTLSALTGVAMLLGLAGAIGAAVLVVVLDEGTMLSAAVGIIACLLIGLGAPGQALPAMLAISSSQLVVIAAVVMEAVALVVLVGVLVAAAGRVRALQFGVAAAGVVAALVVGFGVLTQLTRQAADAPAAAGPNTGALIAVLVALGIGSVAGGVLESMRARRRTAAPEAS